MTYAEMATELGLDWCRGILPTGHYCQGGDHKMGFVTEHTVHFADRRQSKPEVLAFLKLAAVATEPDIDDDVPWRRVFRRGRLVREFSAQLRMRVPGRLWSTDKAFVLASVAGLSNEVPMRKLAFDWARRPRRSTTT